MLHLKKAVRFLATACILQCFPSSCVYSTTPSEVTSWVDEQKQCLQEKLGTDYTIEIFDFTNKDHLYASEKLSDASYSSVPFNDRINNFISRSKLFLEVKNHVSSPFTSWFM